jgi:hypothetical protein
MFSTRDAAALGGGDAGIGARLGVVRDVDDVVVVVVLPRETVVVAGMFAMIVERTAPGVMAIVPAAQPVSDTEDRTAIAPSRRSERRIMPGAKAASTPNVSETGRDCRKTI